jgi:hypothetical protein
MPQVVALMLAGAGLYAGYRWIARQLTQAAAEAARAQEEIARRAAEAAGAPRDLGALEWDEKSGVYKPIDQS